MESNTRPKTLRLMVDRNPMVLNDDRQRDENEKERVRNDLALPHREQ